MRVLHIITSLNNGGAEAVLYRLCTNDTAAHHSVISMMDMGKYGRLLQQAGIPVCCLDMPQGKLTLSGLKKLYQLLKLKNFDIVQTWMYHADLIGGVLARLIGVKTVFWGIRHSSLEKGASKKSTIFIAKLCAVLSKVIPKRIICCADAALKVHAAIGYDRSKLNVIYNGYQLERFSVNPSAGDVVRQQLAINETTKVFGMVGRFDPQKDHANLFASLSIFNQRSVDFVCLLVGTGMVDSNIELMSMLKAKDLVSNIKLLGQRSDIPEVMNALDLHILSSSFGEGFPNVVAEAMACGTPCVTTDVGDAALIVGETGWISPPRNSEAMAELIQQAITEQQTNQDDWQSRRRACRRRIEENFGMETMIRKYHQVWGIR